MNVFLVPAHPGCPGQNLESHKTVVVVAVAVAAVVKVLHFLALFTENMIHEYHFYLFP